MTANIWTVILFGVYVIVIVTILIKSGIDHRRDNKQNPFKNDKPRQTVYVLTCAVIDEALEGDPIEDFDILGVFTNHSDAVKIKKLWVDHFEKKDFMMYRHRLKLEELQLNGLPIPMLSD